MCSKNLKVGIHLDIYEPIWFKAGVIMDNFSLQISVNVDEHSVPPRHAGPSEFMLNLIHTISIQRREQFLDDFVKNILHWLDFSCF